MLSEKRACNYLFDRPNTSSATRLHSSSTSIASPAHVGTAGSPLRASSPRVVAHEAISDLIRYSLVPAVILPAITPALEAALEQMVPAVLAHAVDAASAGAASPSVGSKGRGAAAAAGAASAPGASFDNAILRAQLSSIRDQISATLESLSPSPNPPDAPATQPGLHATGGAAHAASPARPATASAALARAGLDAPPSSHARGAGRLRSPAAADHPPHRTGVERAGATPLLHADATPQDPPLRPPPGGAISELSSGVSSGVKSGFISGAEATAVATGDTRSASEPHGAGATKGEITISGAKGETPPEFRLETKAELAADALAAAEGKPSVLDDDGYSGRSLT